MNETAGNQTNTVKNSEVVMENMNDTFDQADVSSELLKLSEMNDQNEARINSTPENLSPPTSDDKGGDISPIFNSFFDHVSENSYKTLTSFTSLEVCDIWESIRESV